MNELIEAFRASDKVAAFLAIRPTYTFHLVESDPTGSVRSITHVRDSDTRINGGYFIFRREIFDYIGPGEDLVDEPFRRLLNDPRFARVPMALETPKAPEPRADREALALLRGLRGRRRPG